MRFWNIVLQTQIIGIFVGFLLTQLSFKTNKVEEARIDVRKDLLIVNYPYLNKLQEIISLSGEVMFYHTPKPIVTDLDVFIFENSDTAKIVINNKEITVYKGHPDLYFATFTYRFYYYPKNDERTEIGIMHLAINNQKKKRWDDLANEIVANRHQIDDNVYYAFANMSKFLQSNPFPKSTKCGDIENSSWDKRTEKEWQVLNEKLKEEIESFKQLEI